MKKILLLLLLIASINATAQTPQYYSQGGNSLNTFPFFTSGKKIQWLMTPSDYGSTPPTGFITKLYFRGYQTVTNATYNNFLVSLGTTSLTSIPSATYFTGLTTVQSGNPYVIPVINGSTTSAGTTGWFEIPLATPFYYDATQNLLINVEQTGASNGTYLWHLCVSGNRRIYGDIVNPITGVGFDCYRPDFGFDIFAGYPCTGTPTSTVNAPVEVCPNRQFGVSPATFYANATYAWEYSLDGISWTAHPATVGLYGNITDAITVPTWYRCTITCNGGASYTTPAWKVGISAFYYCYCVNNPSTGSGLDIGNVTVTNMNSNSVVLNNGISTPSLSNAQASKTYSTFQYLVPPVVMYRDTTYKFSVSQISSSSTAKNGNVAIFIDMDRNGIFDGNEKVFAKTITTASLIPFTETGTFTIPNTTGIGITGMRVILSDGNTDSCGTYSGEGEVEDYLVDLRYEPCRGGANAGVISASEKTLCVGYDYVLTDTTYEKKKSELERYWEVSADNIGWTGIAGSNNKDQLFYSFTGQPLYYRVRMICTRTNDTTYTPVVKVDRKDGYKCYCYSQAEGGIKDTSDIGGIAIGPFVANSGGAHLMNPVANRKRTDYTDDPAVTLYADSTYSMTIYHTMLTPVHGDAKVTVFMDFNNNKEYDVPYERVYTGYTNVGYFTIIDNIHIPSVLITGVPTGMRVILNNDITPNKPSDLACGGYVSGETEDLMVTFQRKASSGVAGVSSVFNQFALSPNPTHGKFRLQFTTANDMKEVTVTIKNVTGQTVFQNNYKHNGGQFAKDLDMTGQSTGVYFVELSGKDGEKAIKKLVIE